MKYELYDLVEKPEIIPPKIGWESETYYVVWASFFKENPINESIFFLDF